MKSFIAGLLLGLIVVACGAGSKRNRLLSPMDDSKTPWEFCTPEMIPEYKGKLCLVECAEKLKKDGSCKNDKYKYKVKDAKIDHDFFMNKFIAVPEGSYY